MWKLLAPGFILFFSRVAWSQDHHLSHYDVVTAYYNPATTGMFGADKFKYRITADQRSQWGAIGVRPYLTSYAAFDMPYIIRNSKIGFGGYIINNNGGLAKLNSFSMMAAAAYDIIGSQNRKSGLIQKHILSVGLQMGFFYRSTNNNDLSYDVQYSYQDGGAFDKNLPSNEVYSRLNIARFDANLGLYYQYLERAKKVYPYAGFSMSHISRPDESMVGGVKRIPMRFIINAGSKIIVDEKLDLTPRLVYLAEASAYDFTFGLLANYQVHENGTKLQLGLDYRLRDAVIISVGMKQKDYSVRFSYDINTSYLRNFSSGRGAWEISFVYAPRLPSAAAGSQSYGK
jgi:type IX secretion system PorP/SprF family membrane protein